MPNNVFQTEEPNPDNIVGCFIRELMDKYLHQFPDIEETEEQEEEDLNGLV